MKKKESECFKDLIEIAMGAGATVANIIPARLVVVDERVRVKCEVPVCSGYNQFFTCPPYVRSVEKFSKILSRYDWGLLVQVEAVDIDSVDRSTGRIDKTVLADGRKDHLL